MTIELKVPAVGESITEVEIGAWLKNPGDAVAKDEPVVSLESEKATVELPAPEAGTIGKLLKKKGDVAKVGEVIGYLEGNGASAPTPTGRAESRNRAEPRSQNTPEQSTAIMPAAEVLLAQHGLKAGDVKATGPGGRLLKEDVLRHVESLETKTAESPQPPEDAAETTSPAPTQSELVRAGSHGRDEEVVPMSRLRRTVAARLVAAQHSAALLTTFNEVDMNAVMQLRKEYGEAFQQKYNIKLGFMSFFVKAAIEGLKEFPSVNAEVRGNNIVYHNYYDIGVAIGGGKGLVVPVLRNAERMSFSEIEQAIADFAKRAKENKLKVDELTGGTFTISNGGVYGSMMSTPIVNPPQSGVLGLHAIQERPVARAGQVVIRPMMYTALSYDHRIIDGREAVSFLKRLKDVIENPARMLMEV